MQQNLKPNDQRAKNASTLIWLVLTLDLIGGISNYFQYDMLNRYANGATVTQAEIVFNDSRQQIISVLFLLTYLASAIVFIQWFRRAYFNLHLYSTNLTSKEGWAAAAWFVPILSLFRPFQIMRELYEETARVFVKKERTGAYIASTKFLGWWWALWLVHNIINQYVSRTSWKAEEPSELMNVTAVDMISTLIGIPLAIITVKVIKDYAKMEVHLQALSLEETQGSLEEVSNQNEIDHE